MKSIPPVQSLALVLLMLLPAVAAAQSLPPLQAAAHLQWVGAGGASLGWSVDAIGDINGDGVPEIANGSPGIDLPVGPPQWGGPPPTEMLGQVEVRDGKDGSALFTFDGPVPGIPGVSPVPLFGWFVRGIGDVDGDQVPDLAVGAPDDYEALGTVKIYSLANGQLLQTLIGPGVLLGPLPPPHLGRYIERVADMNADGVDELLISAPEQDLASGTPCANPGAVYLHLSTGGSQPFSTSAAMTFTGDPSRPLFGSSLADLGDVTGDGVSDIAIGASGSLGSTHPCSGSLHLGRVYAYNGATGALLWTQDGPEPGSKFGWEMTVGPWSATGPPALFVTAPGASINAAANVGKVFVLDAATGTILAELLPPPSAAPLPEQFGSSVVAMGDRDGDGTDDVAVGAPAFGSATQLGRIYFFPAGVTTTSGLAYPAGQAEGQIPGDGFGWQMAALGDATGDGRDDLLMGAVDASGAVGASSGKSGVLRHVLWPGTGEGLVHLTTGINASAANSNHADYKTAVSADNFVLEISTTIPGTLNPVPLIGVSLLLQGAPATLLGGTSDVWFDPVTSLWLMAPAPLPAVVPSPPLSPGTPWSVTIPLAGVPSGFRVLFQGGLVTTAAGNGFYTMTPAYAIDVF